MTEFKETQKITQWWVWALLFGIAGIWVWGFVYQVLLGHTFGNNPMSNTGLLVGAIFPFGLLIFFYALTLNTEVNAVGIRVKYFPLWSTDMRWEEIRKAEIIKYDFVGYGIRFSGKYGTVFNARGDKGLLLEKTSGEKILIGTQHPERLQTVVSDLVPNKIR